MAVPSKRRMWLWIGGGTLAAAGLVYLTLRKPQHDRDLDALASMLITETGFVHPKREMAQIVFVAINRAAKHHQTLEAVVTPPSQWSVGDDRYKAIFARAPHDPNWNAAREFAAQVVAGQSGYDNEHLMGFVHPSGMPHPPCASNRVATDTIAGERCLPEWAINGRVIGKAMFT